MYQESDDKLGGSALSDTLLFVLLVIAFFVFGAVAAVLRAKFDSSVPLYVFVLIFGVLLYLIYKFRIVGYRYTVFYSEPETEYDPRFDDYITHEDHPYPVGTVVFEKTVSAKGTIVEVIKKAELVAVLDAGEEYECDLEKILGPKKKERSSSIVFRRDGKVTRLYFTPSDRFKEYVKGIIEG